MMSDDIHAPDCICIWCDAIHKLTALEARNAALVEALKKYGRHESHCNKSWQPHYPKCECGLSAALTEQQGGGK